MIRYLKTLGLALFAVFAMSAIVASAASATSYDAFYSEEASTTLTASQEGAKNNKFKILGQTVECETTTYEATVNYSWTMIVSGVVPSYGGCTFTGQPVAIDVGTCTYTLTGTTVGLGDALVDIANCGATPLTITMPTLNCRVTIGNQTASEGVRYTVVGAGATSEVTIDLTAKASIAVDKIGAGSAVCTEIEVLGTGRLTGQVLVTGENPTTKAHQSIMVGSF